DPPKDHEEEKSRKRRRKDAGGSSSKKSKAQDESPHYERGDDAKEPRLEENIEHECHLALTDKIDWTNLEGNRFNHDLSKPLPLVGPLGSRRIPIGYFFNHDLEYLKYRNEDEGFEEMISYLWSPVFKSTIAMLSWEFTSGILTADGSTRADLLNLNQNDIEDLFLLKIQNKIRNIKGVEEFDLVNALQLYIHSIVIKKRVKDVQLGVKSYQTKINLNKPQLMEGCLHQKTPYTILSHPRGVVYEGTDNKKRLIRADELHKFSDGTLNKVYSKLKVILRNDGLGYHNKGMEKHKWTDKDRERTQKFNEKIEKMLKERKSFHGVSECCKGPQHLRTPPPEAACVMQKAEILFFVLVFINCVLEVKEQQKVVEERRISVAETHMNVYSSSSKDAGKNTEKHANVQGTLKEIDSRIRFNTRLVSVAVDSEDETVNSPNIRLVAIIGIGNLVEKDEEVVTKDAEPQRRVNQEEVNAVGKGVSAAEPTVFDDEEVTMTMAQTFIKMKREYNKVQTLFKPNKDVKEPKKKRVADETLFQESFKKLKAVEVSGSESTQEIPSNDPKETSKEDVQNMLEIVPMSEFKVEALQVKYP
nr:hypothetical protein [Tanacetum cinerariifolium]